MKQQLVPSSLIEASKKIAALPAARRMKWNIIHDTLVGMHIRSIMERNAELAARVDERAAMLDRCVAVVLTEIEKSTCKEGCECAPR